MITGIKKLVEVAVTATVWALAMPTLAYTGDPNDRNLHKMYFDGIYSVSDCPRPQVRVTISETMGMKIPSKTSSCGEFLNRQLLDEIWDDAVAFSEESKYCQTKDAVHEPSWYQFKCFAFVQQTYGFGQRCEIVNLTNQVDIYGHCYR